MTEQDWDVTDAGDGATTGGDDDAAAGNDGMSAEDAAELRNSGMTFAETLARAKAHARSEYDQGANAGGGVPATPASAASEPLDDDAVVTVAQVEQRIAAAERRGEISAAQREQTVTLRNAVDGALDADSLGQRLPAWRREGVTTEVVRRVREHVKFKRMDPEPFRKLLVATTAEVLEEDKKTNAEPGSDTDEAKKRLRDRDNAPPGGKGGASGKPSVAPIAAEPQRYGVNTGDGSSNVDYGPRRVREIADRKAERMRQHIATH